MQGDLITGTGKRTTEEKIQWIEKLCFANYISTDGKHQNKCWKLVELNDTQKEILKSLFEKTYSCGAYPRQSGITSALVYYIFYQIFNSPHSLDIGVNCGTTIESNYFLVDLREQLKCHGIAFSKCSSNYLVFGTGKQDFKIFIINQPEDLRGKRLDLMVYDNALEKEKQIQLMLSSCCPNCKVASFMTYDAIPKISL